MVTKPLIIPKSKKHTRSQPLLCRLIKLCMAVISFQVVSDALFLLIILIISLRKSSGECDVASTPRLILVFRD